MPGSKKTANINHKSLHICSEQTINTSTCLKSYYSRQTTPFSMAFMKAPNMTSLSTLTTVVMLLSGFLQSRCITAREHVSTTVELAGWTDLTSPNCSCTAKWQSNGDVRIFDGNIPISTINIGGASGLLDLVKTTISRPEGGTFPLVRGPTVWSWTINDTSLSLMQMALLFGRACLTMAINKNMLLVPSLEWDWIHQSGLLMGRFMPKCPLPIQPWIQEH